MQRAPDAATDLRIPGIQQMEASKRYADHFWDQYQKSYMVTVRHGSLQSHRGQRQAHTGKTGRAPVHLLYG